MKNIAKNVLLFCIVLAAWQIASMFTIPLFIPSPMSVVRSLLTMIQNGMLLSAAIYSLRRITVSVVIAAVISLICALAMQINDVMKACLYPLMKLMRYLPATAFYPLLIAWAGIGETMKIAFLCFVSFVYMMPTVCMTLEDAPKGIIEAGKALGMNRRQVLIHIVFPYCLPSILKSFALMYGIGWTYITVAEETNAIYGLGYMVNNASSRGRTDVVFAAIIVIVVVSIIFDRVADIIIKKMFKWRD